MKSEFSINFSGGVFHRVSFIECKFDRALMRKTEWRACSFAGTVMVADMTDALFEDCSFVRARIKGLGQGYGGRRTRFVRCDFGECVFDRVQFLAGRLAECEISTLRI